MAQILIFKPEVVFDKERLRYFVQYVTKHYKYVFYSCYSKDEAESAANVIFSISSSIAKYLEFHEKNPSGFINNIKAERLINTAVKHFKEFINLPNASKDDVSTVAIVFYLQCGFDVLFDRSGALANCVTLSRINNNKAEILLEKIKGQDDDVEELEKRLTRLI